MVLICYLMKISLKLLIDPIFEYTPAVLGAPDDMILERVNITSTICKIIFYNKSLIFSMRLLYHQNTLEARRFRMYVRIC